MGKFNFTDEFKREAVAQIVERGYSVRWKLTIAKAEA